MRKDFDHGWQPPVQLKEVLDPYQEALQKVADAQMAWVDFPNKANLDTLHNARMRLRQLPEQLMLPIPE